MLLKIYQSWSLILRSNWLREIRSMNVNQEDSTQEEKKRQLFLQKRLRVKNLSVLLARRIARVVEWTGLENQRTARYRGFESLLLRK